MITLQGEKMASRVASSLLMAVGLGELVCTSHSQYEELAVALAEDSDRLYSFRQNLENRRNSCAAFDTPRWVRNMEQGLTEAWGRYVSELRRRRLFIMIPYPNVVFSPRTYADCFFFLKPLLYYGLSNSVYGRLSGTTRAAPRRT
jgi:hypothetical protein